jgi:putative Mn2+ efflux pump MntP
MDINCLIIVSIALAMDASAIALSIGINSSVKRYNKVLFAISFGFFQFLLSFFGIYFGVLFEHYITSIPNIIGGMVIAFTGVFMIKDGMEQKDQCLLLNPKMYIVLGISVSIDALVVGFTVFHHIEKFYMIVASSVTIGLVTLFLSICAFFLSRYMRRIELISKYADYIGGIILLLFGLKMIFS